jgi:lipoyl synthase
MIQHLRAMPAEVLQAEAFRLRRAHFGKKLTFALPGTVSYRDKVFPTRKERFAAVSVTGRHCDLRCRHCRGTLLDAMIPAETPEAFLEVARHLLESDGQGLLLSGGADREGRVPLTPFLPAIRTVKTQAPSFKIIVHTGLLDRETALGLKDAGIDQVLIDIIGDDGTIREVYGLDRRVEDYEETLLMLKALGHRIVPHIIIGHHFGEIRGEWRALEIVSRIGIETLVLVLLKSLSTPSAEPMAIPDPEEACRIAAASRVLNPSLPIRMGCIRPVHPVKARLEKGFIDSGVNTVAHPLQGTIDYAREIGLETEFTEMCCSLT